MLTSGNAHMPGPLTFILAAIGIFPVVLPGKCSDNEKTSKPLMMESQLSSLSKADTWINTKPLTGEELKGKVVLIEFCTYTCINWLRTLPYVRAWEQKYKDQGLVVIGVHTPEFVFEKNTDNVSRAISDMKIDFPIAIDNNYKIWNAFSNQYWPALYLIDAAGRVVHHQFGEGGYDETEIAIQHLLTGTTSKSEDIYPVSVPRNSIEAAADWQNLKSEENYLGYERTINFTSISSVTAKPYTYHLNPDLPLNGWAIAGNWTVEKQSIKLNNPNGKLEYRFHARDLHLVMGPVSAGSKIRFRVLIDGKPPDADHGADIDSQGYGITDQQRLYQLIRQTGRITDHTFQIEFFDPGAEAFSFTFG